MGKKKERENKRKYLCVKHIHTHYFMESSEILYLVISSACIEEKISVRLSDFAKIVEFASGKAREPRVNPKSTVLQSILPAYKWYTPSKVVSKSSAYQKQEMKREKMFCVEWARMVLATVRFWTWNQAQVWGWMCPVSSRNESWGQHTGACVSHNHAR